MRDHYKLDHLDTTDASTRLADARDEAAMVDTAFALLAALSPRQRELVACLRSGLTVAQAAKVMRVQRGTAYGYWARVQRKIAEVSSNPPSA